MPKPSKYINKNTSSDFSYKQKPSGSTFQPSYKGSPVGQTQYLPLTNQDLLYVGNLQRCKSYDFVIILRKITKNLNFLLQFKYEDFWMELRTSQTLRHCLQSCLQIFPRKSFSAYVNKSSTTVQQQKMDEIFQNETFRMFSHLMRIVLFIYYRIVCESKQSEKQTIYDLWLLDIPKMLNLISIYKNTNYKILKQILNTAFKEIPSYYDDVNIFTEICVITFIQALQKDLGYEYTAKVIRQSTNFNNPMLSFTRNLIKCFFRSLDIFITINDFVQFFPTKYVIILIGEPDFVLSLMDTFFMYTQNIEGVWELTKQFVAKFAPVIEIIRQNMLNFFIKTFDILDNLLSEYMVQEQWYKCLKVYFSICNEFYGRHKSPRGTLWQILINTIILETPHRSIFRLQAFFSKRLGPKQMNIIKQCQQYERKFRKDLSRKNFLSEQIIQLKLSCIKSFRQWKDFENCKSFDVMIEDSYAEDTIRQDSILNLIKTEMTKTQSKKKDPYTKTKYSKPNKFPFFPQEEYNDQPPYEVQEVQQTYQFPFGMQPFEEKLNNMIQVYDIHEYINDGAKIGYQKLPYDMKINTEIEIDIKKQNQFKKNKQKYDIYQKYYNNKQEINVSNTNSNNNTKTSSKKQKKSYVGYDELSIQYSNPNENLNIKIEKASFGTSSNIFKSHQQSNAKKIIKKNKKKIQLQQQNSRLSLSIAQNKDNSSQFELEDIIKAFDRQQLTINETQKQSIQASSEACIINKLQFEQKFQQQNFEFQDDFALDLSGIQKISFKQIQLTSNKKKAPTNTSQYHKKQTKMNNQQRQVDQFYDSNMDLSIQLKSNIIISDNKPNSINQDSSIISTNSKKNQKYKNKNKKTTHKQEW